MKESDADPMHAANSAPRCTAKSKRSGHPCQAPAVRGWNVCRMHGARGGSRPGKAHPNYKHGVRSHEATALRAYINTLGREARSRDDAL